MLNGKHLVCDFSITSKDSTYTISVDTDGNGVSVLEYPFVVKTLTLSIQTNDKVSSTSGTFTTASGSIEVEAISVLPEDPKDQEDKKK